VVKNHYFENIKEYGLSKNFPALLDQCAALALTA
jgi:hypothetical protein